MRWTQENLQKSRYVLYVGAAVVILVLYVLSWL